MTFAVLPATIEKAGTSFVTTAPAATMLSYLITTRKNNSPWTYPDVSFYMNIRRHILCISRTLFQSVGGVLKVMVMSPDDGILTYQHMVFHRYLPCDAYIYIWLNPNSRTINNEVSAIKAVGRYDFCMVLQSRWKARFIILRFILQKCGRSNSLRCKNINITMHLI